MGSDWSWAKGMRIWFDQSDKGGKEYPGPDPIGDARAFVAKLESAGVKQGPDFKYTEYPGTEQNEAAWQARVEPLLLFLYGSASTSAATNPVASGGR